MKLLIDGDLLVHRSTVACEHDACFDDRYHILWSDANTAWNILEDTLHELSEQSGLSDYKIIFSDPNNNFRKKLSGDYKSHRENTRKPLAYWDVRERCEETFECMMLPNIEADDTMGLLLTKYPDEYVLWTLDKDLKQIHGKHLIDDEIMEITPQEGEDFFYYQVLAGDAVDGYTGCPAIGDKRAKDIVQRRVKIVPTEHTLKSGKRKGEVETRWIEEPCDNLWEIVCSYYDKEGLSESVALYNARMARILQHGEYKKGEPILWTPTQQ